MCVPGATRIEIRTCRICHRTFVVVLPKNNPTVYLLMKDICCSCQIKQVIKFGKKILDLFRK